MAICEELYISNFSLKNLTWENVRERMPRCPKAPIQTHISTLFVHDFALEVNLLLGTKAGHSQSKPMSRSQKVNRAFERPHPVKRALAGPYSFPSRIAFSLARVSAGMRLPSVRFSATFGDSSRRA